MQVQSPKVGSGLEGTVPTKVTRVSLVVCLFLFLFVVIGGGLHLNPGGAFLAARQQARH